ncbi:hypothetical protein BDN70DRAFT_373347 [Pholiota conissans]|uniref:Secreted protein n=1 Tax=Pholiota conissans TaxID=109636 RepID=A0A9P6CWH3_9AGAR|nr:hypothetical protein BDN70DRAFT_373347 [Pholiota conissans]
MTSFISAEKVSLLLLLSTIAMFHHRRQACLSRRRQLQCSRNCSLLHQKSLAIFGLSDTALSGMTCAT